MRALVVGASAASLVGCSCFVSLQSGINACTDVGKREFACFDRNVPAPRLSQTTKPESTSLDSSIPIPREKAALAARTVTSSSAHSGRPSPRTAKATSPTATAKVEPTATAKPEPAAAGQPANAIDNVIDRAKIALAVKLENPASAALSENRSMQNSALGQSVDTICGHGKSRKASSEDIGHRPFLQLVKNDEAYVADGPPTSAPSTAYRNIFLGASRIEDLDISPNPGT
jgi:hypothetical protein